MTTCDVCYKNQTQRVCNSQLSPTSNAYCDVCFQIGLEPWSDFVATLFSLNCVTEKQVTAAFSDHFLKQMLRFHKKTIKDAIQEAQKTEEEYIKYYKQQERDRK